MKIPKEEYKRAKGYLLRYTYNCINILMITSNINGISAINYDGMPHAKNTINDVVLNTVIKIEDNKELARSIGEYNVVKKALELVNKESLYIFEHLFDKKDMTKWEIIENLCVSEETYKRRYKKLIYAVAEEIAKS